MPVCVSPCFYFALLVLFVFALLCFTSPLLLLYALSSYVVLTLFLLRLVLLFFAFTRPPFLCCVSAHLLCFDVAFAFACGCSPLAPTVFFVALLVAARLCVCVCFSLLRASLFYHALRVFGFASAPIPVFDVARAFVCGCPLLLFYSAPFFAFPLPFSSSSSSSLRFAFYCALFGLLFFVFDLAFVFGLVCSSLRSPCFLFCVALAICVWALLLLLRLVRLLLFVCFTLFCFVFVFVLRCLLTFFVAPLPPSFLRCPVLLCACSSLFRLCFAF